MQGTAVGLLDREARLLVERLRLWTPARWGAATPSGGSRADVVRHLAQWCADRAAELESLPRRPLPALADLAVPDQLAVTAHDLVAAKPDEPQAVTATAHLLLHRAELLGDPVPDGLVSALGLADAAAVLALGTSACG